MFAPFSQQIALDRAAGSLPADADRRQLAQAERGRRVRERRAALRARRGARRRLRPRAA